MRKHAPLSTKTMIWLKYIVPFLIIMLLSAIVGVFIYQRTSSVLEEEVKDSNRVLLEQGMGG
ncbi:hypothetical protein N6H14_26025 [Paenibacillus sp. CC-CFT747]|nr:hypothetical protein N6H14_26025 [Paenibacillus sp. CC-CFT747]